ncbi:MAG: MFS transporter [Myxococcota bacterium]
MVATETKSAPGAAPVGRSPLFVIFFTVFLDLLGFGIIIPILPFYAEQFGATPTVVTALGASYSLMQFVFAPAWGRLSDRIGRRPVILVSVLMSAVGYGLLGLVNSLALLFACRILSGIGNANIPTAQAYIADVTTPENRAKGMGLLGMAFGFGFIIGPGVGAAAASLGEHLSGGDPNALFNHASLPAFVAGGLALVDFVFALVVLPESLKKGTHPAPTSRRRLSLDALKRASQRPNVGVLLALYFVVLLGWSKMEATFGLLVERRFVAATPGTPAAAAEASKLTGLFLVLVGVISAIIQGGLIGKLARRFGERKLLITGLACNALAFALLPFAPSYAMTFPVVLLMSSANGLVNPSMSSLLSQSADPTEQGGTLGLGQSLAALARAMGPVFGGILFEQLGYQAPYLAGGLILLLSAFIATSVKQPVKPA